MGDHARTSRSPSIGLTGPDGHHGSSPPAYTQLSSSLDNGGAAYPMFTSIETANGPYHMAEQNAFLNPSSPQPFSDPNFPGSKRNSIGSRPASLNLTNSNYDQFPAYQQGEFSVIDPALQNPQQSINPADIMADQEAIARHSRHASLDPTTTILPQVTQGEWQHLASSTYGGHRRAPSEHSDISSVGPSPHMPQDGFDPYINHSPLLHPQQTPDAYQSTLGLERFTLSDGSGQGLSPRHSPFPSPRMAPLQSQIPMVPSDQFVLQNNDEFNSSPGPAVYSPEMGQAPAINISFAPTRQVELHANDPDHDALSPPARSRGRANSAPMSRPLSPEATSPQFESSRQRSLSPFEPHFSDRGSPGASKSSRRSSTSSIPNRDYILDLADPNRTATATGGNSVKVQKHPATFQCTLCPKRFTRAYNLRSHLRTHTDERPFVCTVCGKAFARQHDRKRHEGLHSGEKKFVCKGELAGNGQWGCGRRFARADALGRHFRSEAGRVCIKPLLDEEAAERQRQYEQQFQMGMVPPQMDVNGGFALPAALLAQYPALQGFSLNAASHDERRASFDASSQGEYYEDEDPGSGYVSGPGTAYGQAWAGEPPWASDYEGR